MKNRNRNRDSLQTLMFVLGFLAVGLILLATTLEAAEPEPTTLRFAWGYDSSAQAIIDGFRLYENNQALAVVIPPAARTVETPYIKDRLARRYHLTAFAGDEESAPSAHVDIAAHWTGVPAVLGGQFNVQILDAEGNVIQEINSSVQGTINQ